MSGVIAIILLYLCIFILPAGAVDEKFD